MPRPPLDPSAEGISPKLCFSIPKRLYAQLKDVAVALGKPQSVIAREVLEAWIAQRVKEREELEAAEE